MVVNLVNLIVFKRWNTKIGLSDKLFVLGSGVFQNIVKTWTWIPGMLMISQLCPEGVEATMFALMAGCGNFGASLASYEGAFILDILSIQPNGTIGESAQFDNLWIASLVSTCLPLIPLFFLTLLIPDVRQTEKVLVDGDSKEIPPSDLPLSDQLETTQNGQDPSIDPTEEDTSSESR